jgi:hypothetical protein
LRIFAAKKPTLTLQISSDVDDPYKKAGGVFIEEMSCTITLGQGGHNPVLPVKRLRSVNKEHLGGHEQVTL